MLRYYEPELADDAGDYMTILGFACKRGDGLKASRYQKPVSYTHLAICPRLVENDCHDLCLDT